MTEVKEEKVVVDNPNKPLKKYRMGGVTATVWKNETEKDGKLVEYHTVSVERSYKDGDVWKTTNSMRISDLPRVSVVCMKAYEFLSLVTE